MGSELPDPSSPSLGAPCFVSSFTAKQILEAIRVAEYSRHSKIPALYFLPYLCDISKIAWTVERVHICPLSICTTITCWTAHMLCQLIRLGCRPQPIKFILPEFVPYLGGRGVLYVGNGSHFCTPVLMTTFQGLRLITFVFTKC